MPCHINSRWRRMAVAVYVSVNNFMKFAIAVPYGFTAESRALTSRY